VALPANQVAIQRLMTESEKNGANSQTVLLSLLFFHFAGVVGSIQHKNLWKILIVFFLGCFFFSFTGVAESIKCI
jgi:hypothetical protein